MFNKSQRNELPCGSALSKNPKVGESSSKKPNSTHQVQLGKCRFKQDFGALFNSQVRSDVSFVVDKDPHKKLIPAHTFILSVGSEVFCDMFKKHPASKLQKITVPDVEPEVFLAVLKFLYTDEVTVTTDNVTAVSNAAKEYGIPALQNRCVQFLQQELCPKNAFKILKQAVLLDEPKLVNSCLEIIDSNTSEAIDADGFTDIGLGTLCCVLKRDTLSIKEEKLMKAVVRWSKAECARKNLPVNAENHEKILGRALFFIRFRLMSSGKFASKEARSRIRSDKKLVSTLLYFAKEKNTTSKLNVKPRSAKGSKLPPITSPLKTKGINRNRQVYTMDDYREDCNEGLPDPDDWIYDDMREDCNEGLPDPDDWIYDDMREDANEGLPDPDDWIYDDMREEWNESLF